MIMHSEFSHVGRYGVIKEKYLKSKWKSHTQNTRRNSVSSHDKHLNTHLSIRLMIESLLSIFLEEYKYKQSKMYFIFMMQQGFKFF